MTTISGPLSFLNVDHLCAGIDTGRERPVIDLSGVTFFEPFALIYLGMYLRYHNSLGKDFDVIPPQAQHAAGYLARQNFWERFNFKAEVVAQENLRRFTTSTSLNDIVDIERREAIAEEILDNVLVVLRRRRLRVNTEEVAEHISELVDNFAQHSGRLLAVFMMQHYPQGGRVVFAIGDCGVGIRASLASNPKYAGYATAEHYEAAARAFEPLVTRKPEGGYGLTMVREWVCEQGGTLVLSTGDGFVVVRDDETRYGRMAYDLPGVQIEVSIPVRG